MFVNISPSQLKEKRLNMDRDLDYVGILHKLRQSSQLQ